MSTMYAVGNWGKKKKKQVIKSVIMSVASFRKKNYGYSYEQTK